MLRAPRLIYVVTEDWHFLSHCLPMARAARSAGFEIHIASSVGEDAAQIRDEGFTLHPVRFARGRLSPFQTVRAILIAADVPGCREIVIHEKTGLLVPVDDPQALAAAILRLARSSPQRVRFGVAARRLVDERFAADLVGEAAVALYRRLLAY